MTLSRRKSLLTHCNFAHWIFQINRNNRTVPSLLLKNTRKIFWLLILYAFFFLNATNNFVEKKKKKQCTAKGAAITKPFWSIFTFCIKWMLVFFLRNYFWVFFFMLFAHISSILMLLLLFDVLKERIFNFHSDSFHAIKCEHELCLLI